MTSPEATALADALRRLRDGAAEPTTIDEARSAAEAFGDLTAEPEGVSYAAAVVGGVPGLWVDPAGADGGSVLVYLHGGGYGGCSARSHRKLAGHIARATGCRALAVDYRLAPEHSYPAAVEDATAAVRGLIASGWEPSRLALAGDSAGGGLALAALVRLRDEGVPLPAACACLSPWVDLACTGESMATRADVDLLLSKPALLAAAGAYLQGADPRNPLASPLHADLAGLPPVHVQVGDDEVLLDDARRLAAAAERAGVEVRLDVFPGMQHVFQVSAGHVPEADDAVARLGAWLAPRLVSI